MKNKGFTLIEIVIVIAILSVLSLVILFSITQYINKGKDANISGNLSVLVPAGEAYYNMGNSYENFCTSNSVINAKSQMPFPSTNLRCETGLCCNVSVLGNEWAACAQEFTNTDLAFCVDNRGVKKEISNSDCTSYITQCP